MVVFFAYTSMYVVREVASIFSKRGILTEIRNGLCCLLSRPCRLLSRQTRLLLYPWSRRRLSPWSLLFRPCRLWSRQSRLLFPSSRRRRTLNRPYPEIINNITVEQDEIIYQYAIRTTQTNQNIGLILFESLTYFRRDNSPCRPSSHRRQSPSSHLFLFLLFRP